MRIQGLNSLLEKRFKPAESKRDCDDFYSWTIGESEAPKPSERIIILMNNKTNYAIALRGIKRTSYSPSELIENEIRISLLDSGVAPDVVDEYFLKAGSIYYNNASGSSSNMKQVKLYLDQVMVLHQSLVKGWHQKSINTQINSIVQNSMMNSNSPQYEMMQALKLMAGREVLDQSAASERLEEMKESIAIHLGGDATLNKRFVPNQEQAHDSIPKLRTISINTQVLPSLAKVANNAAVFIRKRPFRLFEQALDVCTSTGKFIAFVSAGDAKIVELNALPYGSAMKGTIIKVNRKNAVELDLSQKPFSLPDYLVPPNSLMHIRKEDQIEMKAAEAELRETSIVVANELVPGRIDDLICEKVKVGMVLPVTYGFSVVTVKDLDELSESFRTVMRDEPVLSHQIYLDEVAIGGISSLINVSAQIATNPLFFEIATLINDHPEKQLVALIKKIEQRLAFKLEITIDLFLVECNSRFLSKPPQQSVRKQNSDYFNYDEVYEINTLNEIMKKVQFTETPNQTYDDLLGYEKSGLTVPILFQGEKRHLVLNFCSISQSRTVYQRRDPKVVKKFVGQIL